MERRGRLTLGAGLVAWAALAWTMLAGVAAAADQGVDIAGFAFSPATIRVAVGDRVAWSNADDVGHTATADDGSFDTGTIAAGASASVTFTTAGRFAYHCSIHPSMAGTVVVGSPSVPQTDAATPIADEDAGTRGGDARWLALLVAAATGAWAVRRRLARARA